MAFQTKDGKSFGSRFKQRRYDSMHATPEAADIDKKKKMAAEMVGEGDKSLSKPKSATVPKAAGRTNPQGEAKASVSNASAPDNNSVGMNMAEGSPEAAADVVTHHGPAVHTHVHSNHLAGKHHVVSHHADGHMHVSGDHATAQDAHNEAAQLGTGSDMPSESDNQVGPEDFAEGNEPSDQNKLPRMA